MMRPAAGSRRFRLPDPLLMLTGALLTAIPLIWPAMAPLGWVSLVPAASVMLRRASSPDTRLRRLWCLGMCFCYPYYCLVYHWFFAMYPLEFAGMTRGAAAAVVLVACFGLALLHGVIFSLAFPMMGLMFRSPLCRRLPVLRLILGPAVWCIFEWMQTQTWIGVPWGRLALGQTSWLPVIQTASLLGSYLITYLLVLVAFLLADALLRPRRAQMRILAALLVFGVNFTVGSALYLIDAARADERILRTVSAVQGNISSAEKWEGNQLEQILTTYTRLTGEAAARGAKLVVWPETVIPHTVFGRPWLVETLEAVSAEYGVTLLVGAFTADEAGTKNSILIVTPESGIRTEAYSKRHLVPFGEYLPMADFIRAVCPPLAELQMAGADLVPGDDAAVAFAAGARIGSLICFDSIYETLALDSVRAGANLICLSTNDSWFGDSAAADQHNRQAILRAVETRRSVVRAANTGISSVINPRGMMTSSLGALVEGQITDRVELCEETTLYVRIGNLFVWVCMGGCAAALASRLMPRQKTKKVAEHA